VKIHTQASSSSFSNTVSHQLQLEKEQLPSASFSPFLN